MNMREGGDAAPFNIFSPGPFRLPAVLLLIGGPVILLALIGVTHALDIARSPSPTPMVVTFCGYLLVGGCAWVASDRRGGKAVLYVAVIATMSVSIWLAVDDVNRRQERQSTQRRLVSDLNALCSRAGGRMLADPVCADYLRVLDNYNYPDGVPALLRALRDQASNGGETPDE